MLFAITGITLNHAASIETTPVIDNRIIELPPDLVAELSTDASVDSARLPDALSDWLSQQLPVSIGSRKAEWSDDEVYLSMPGPGRDTWLSIDRSSGEVEFESTKRGWLSYFNDLHKGRNTGPAWRWFLDIFALATMVFCLTGLMLLWIHARQRRMTWPLVGLGFVIPAILALLFIH